METNKSLVECNNCHKSVSVPLNETMVRCPYCNAIMIIYHQELPKAKKSSTLEKKGVEDK